MLNNNTSTVCNMVSNVFLSLMGGNGSGRGKDGGRGDAGAPVMLLGTSRVMLTATNATTTAETGALGVVIPEDPKET
jgi:hypothetical protein